MNTAQAIASNFWEEVQKSHINANQREPSGGISTFAFVGLMYLDKPLVGTYDYMGKAYFWNYKYRHFLRDASHSKRRRVHRMMLDAGLDVSGDTDKHDEIIRKIFGECPRE